MIRRRSFLLLELLIAFFLFSACLLPLTSIPFHALTAQLSTYQRLQLHRIGDLVFAEIKAKLFRGEISWEQLNVPKDKKTCVYQEPLALKIKGLGSRVFDCQGFIWSGRQKTGKNQDEYRLATVEIVFKTNQKNFFRRAGNKKNQFIVRHQVFVIQQSGIEEEKPSKAPLPPLTA